MCRIQNDYADILEKSCSQSIKQLSIHSDWIGNVGIKKLILCQQFFFNYDQLMKTMKYLDAK